MCATRKPQEPTKPPTETEGWHLLLARVSNAFGFAASNFRMVSPFTMTRVSLLPASGPRSSPAGAVAFLGALLWLAFAADAPPRATASRSTFARSTSARSSRAFAAVPLGGVALENPLLENLSSHPRPLTSSPRTGATRPVAVASKPAPATPVASKPLAALKPISAKPISALSPLRPSTASKRLVRVGLRTKGGPLRFWCESPLSIYDPARPASWTRVPARVGVSVQHAPKLTSAPNAAATPGAKSVLSVRVLSVGLESGALDNALFANSQMLVLRSDSGAPVRMSSDNSSAQFGRPYRGILELAPQTFSFDPATHQGELRLVNVVGLEEYLQGVVPWEMSPSAPLEALKAQAICARSETLSKIASARHARDGFEMCDFDHCQGYPGTENETPMSSRAVQETRGLAIFHGGRIADAVYGTNSGGVTASSSDVWRGQEPYLVGVADFSRAQSPELAALWPPRDEAGWAKFCATPWPSFARPSEAARRELARRRLKSARTFALFGPDDWPEFYRWSRTIPASAMKQAFASKGVAQVTSIQVAERSPSGHIKRLRVNGPSQSVSVQDLHFITIELKGDGPIRSMLSGRLGSTSALPSSTFVVTPQRDASGQVVAWKFQGAGWGHGVGMCQRGAQNHALGGWTARQIIAYYYRGVEIRQTN